MTTPIDRGFVRTSAGLIHYRSAGDDTALPPIVLLHGGPGSSASLVPLLAALAAGRRVIAPDTPGCGSSDPLGGEPTIGRFAAVLAEFLDCLDMPQVDLYGHHTGAQIGCELAIANPALLRRAVFDGTALFPAALRAEFLERYAPPLVPVADGSHLMWIWDFASRLTRFFPHYLIDETHRTVPGVELPPASVTTIAAEVLKVWPTWHLAYRAAFNHDLAARLPLVQAPVLVLRSAGDPLAEYAASAAALLPRGRLADVTRDKAATVAEFLAG